MDLDAGQARNMPEHHLYGNDFAQPYCTAPSWRGHHELHDRRVRLRREAYNGASPTIEPGGDRDLPRTTP